MTMQLKNEIEADAILLLDPTTRILIVDDESRIRLSLRSCLEAEGYDVAEACDGAEAIGVILNMQPDLVLLDLAMPHMDGMSMLRELRSRLGGTDAKMPRIVVLTAWGSPAVEEEAFLCGVRDFVAKPLSPRALRAVVERVLRQPPAQTVDEVDRHEDDDDGDVGPFGHLYFG